MKLPNAPPIYLDYHATTPVDPRVAAVVLHAMTTAFGNANSTEHVYGEMAAALLTDARREVADLVNADPEGVHFTSGSSESIRLALAHAVAGRWHRPLRVAVTTVEHRAVLDAVAVDGAGRREPVYAFRRETKPDITTTLFEYCLYDYWQRRHAGDATLTYRDVAMAPGGLGQLLQLPEDDIRTRLDVYAVPDALRPFGYQLSAVQGLVTRRDVGPRDFLAAVYTEEDCCV